MRGFPSIVLRHDCGLDVSMKIAVVLLPKTSKPPLVLLDAKDQTARMFFITAAQQFAFFLVLLVGALVAGYFVYDPATRITSVSAVRVPRPQQVVFLEADATLEVGDDVFVPAVFAPNACKIVALPSQSLQIRSAGAPARFLILGQDSYYVTVPNGHGQIVHRADLRQLVSN